MEEQKIAEGLLWTRIINVGRALEKLNVVLDNEIFDNLSKHNPKWNSEHENESETLYQTRCTLNHIQEQLYEVFALLKGD